MHFLLYNGVYLLFYLTVYEALFDVLVFILHNACILLNKFPLCSVIFLLAFYHIHTRIY